MEQWWRRWGVAAVLLLAGALLRAWFVAWHPWIAGDSLLYGDLAVNMLRHHVYGFTEAAKIRPTLIRLPGYPGFLTVCFAAFGAGNFAPVMWVQAAVDLWTCCLLGALGTRLMGRRAGLAVLGVGMLCPFTANYCAVPLTETLTIFCVALAFYSLERWSAGVRAGKAWNVWLGAIAFALAYGMLLRPDEALVVVAVLPAMVWIGWRAMGGLVKGSGPGLAVAAMVVVPFLLWGVRNWRVFHVVQPLAPRYANDPGEPNPYGFQRWYRTWAIDFKATVDVYWNYDGSQVALGDLPARAFDNDAEQVETARLYRIYNYVGMSTKPVDAAFGRLASERIAAHPVRYYVVIPALKLADMWLRPRTEYMRLPLDWWAFRAHPWQSWVSLGYAVWNAAYLVLAVVGLWRWRKVGGVLLAVMVGFVTLRCVLLWTLDNAEPRYTLECFPVVILLAGFAVMRGNVGDSVEMSENAS